MLCPLNLSLANASEIGRLQQAFSGTGSHISFTIGETVAGLGQLGGANTHLVLSSP